MAQVEAQQMALVVLMAVLVRTVLTELALEKAKSRVASMRKRVAQMERSVLRAAEEEAQVKSALTVLVASQIVQASVSVPVRTVPVLVRVAMRQVMAVTAAGPLVPTEQLALLVVPELAEVALAPMVMEAKMTAVPKPVLARALAKMRSPLPTNSRDLRRLPH